MAKPPESNSSLFPKSDDREDSGLQDILAVAAKIKESPEEDVDAGSGSEREDSGLIMFSAGDFGAAPSKPEEEDALFGSFAGGLAAGFATPVDPISSPDLVPLGGEGSVRETKPAEVRGAQTQEPKRSPLTAIAVVLGLSLVAVGVVFLTHDDEPAQPQQQAQAEMTANPEADAAVGKAEPEVEDPAGAGASAGAVVEPEPIEEAVGETEGAVLGEEAGDGLLAGADTDGDPMAQKQGLLAGGSEQVAKSGKWDQGTSYAKPAVVDDADDSAPDPEPEPDPDPIVAPEPAKKPAGGGNNDEVDCLLNPDLPKCSGGGSSQPKNNEVLAPKVPDKLDSGQLRDGFNTAKSKAKACGSKFGAAAGTKVKVHVSIEGETGKVSSVEAQGEHAGTDLGKCVEDAVKTATFEVFKKPSQGVDYSMIM